MTSNSSTSLWVRTEPFTYGVFQVHPHPRLGVSNIKKLVAYAKNKGKSGYPKLSYSVWKYIACGKLQIPEDLVWTLFHTCIILSASHMYKLKELEQKLAACQTPEELEQVRCLQNVDLYRFVLFLYIQQINKISLRASIVSANAEWPGSLSKSVDYNSGRHTPGKASKNLDEQVQWQFVSEHLMNILDLLVDAESYSPSNNEPTLSHEAIDSLSFILEGSMDKNKTIKTFCDIAHSTSLSNKTGYVKLRHCFLLQNFHSWIRSCLEVNPFSVETCVTKGKRLHWPLPSLQDDTVNGGSGGGGGRGRAQEDPLDQSHSGTDTPNISSKDKQNRQRIATTANILPRGDTSKGNKLIVMSMVSCQTVARSSGTLQDASVTVHRSHYAFIYLLSPMRCVSVSKCHKLTLILGPVENSLLVSNCDECVIIAACRRLVVSNCRRCTFHLLTPTRPLLIMGPTSVSATSSSGVNVTSNSVAGTMITGNEELTLAPMYVAYGTLEEHLARAGLDPTVNMWNQPLCIGIDTNRQELPYHIWACMPPEQFFPFTIPFIVPGDTKDCPITLPSDYKAALERRRLSQEKWQQSIKNSHLSPDEAQNLRIIIEERFRTWLQETGHQRQLDLLQGNSLSSPTAPTPRELSAYGAPSPRGYRK